VTLPPEVTRTGWDVKPIAAFRVGLGLAGALVAAVETSVRRGRVTAT
jgi:hypothetical protein